MEQAKGAGSVLAVYGESAFRTSKSIGAKLRFTKNGLQKKRNLIPSQTIGAQRTRGKPFLGNVDINGPIEVELGAELPCNLFYHALGGITTSGSVRSVTTTGATSATTISFSAPPSGTTATATISGGVVTVTNNGSGYQSSPTITLDHGTGTAVMSYDHLIIPDNTLPPGLTLETDFGSAISGAGRYVAYKGCKIGSIDIDFPTEGPVMATFNVVGAEAVVDDAPIDEFLTDYGHKPFEVFSCSITEGGSAIATIQTAKVTINNDLDTSGYTISGDGTRQALSEGIAEVTGTITALFTDADLMNKSLANTESSLVFVLQRGTGSGSPGNEYISITIPHLIYEPTIPPINGPKGIVITANFSAFYGAAAEEAIRIRIRNQMWAAAAAA